MVVRAEAGEPAPASALSISVRWRGLRALASAVGAPAGASVDLRRKAGDPSTTVAGSGAALGGDTTAKLLVEDEDLIGTTVFAVVLDAADTVIAQSVIEVGADA